MKVLKTILKILGWILGVVVLVVAVALVVFTIAEYRPADVETVIPELRASASRQCSARRAAHSAQMQYSYLCL